MKLDTIAEKNVLIDRLNRAYQMEGEMDSELVNLCQMDSLPKDLSEESRLRIHTILSGIKADTLRHRAIVSKIRNDNVKMDNIILAARVRQLLAVDTNAYALYADLAFGVDDKCIKEDLLEISRDTKRHCVLQLEVLSILEVYIGC